MGGLLLSGKLKSTQRMSSLEAERMLQKMANHPLSDIRNAFNTLKKLVGIVFYGNHDHDWKALGYDTVLANRPKDDSKIQPIDIQGNTTLDCDVVVVGSGSGGGLMASILAAKGYHVIVVEKGQYFRDTDFTQRELPMLRALYESQGLMATKDGGISILAGSTLGGGSTVNWAGALRTPDYVLEEWANEFANPQFLSADYKKGFEYVEQRNGVTSDYGYHNPQNQKLADAAQQLGYQANTIPSNVRFNENISAEANWKALGFSCIGDVYGTKQSTVKTFLQDAVALGTQIITGIQVNKITIQQGKATGIEGQVGAHQVTIHAKKVVVSAGALHTPVLLKKSGLRHDAIGKNLFLHPVTPIPALYKDVMKPWNGPMMSTIVNDFSRMDANWGVRIECPPAHPGLMAVVLPWKNGAAYKQEVLDAQHNGVFFGLVRDRFPGEVRVSKKSGQPEIHYKLHDYDKKHLIRGMQEVVRLHHSAGAERITVLHNQPFYHHKGNDIEKTIAHIPTMRWDVNRFGTFSAHQMGTCHIGGHASAPVKPNGETREVQNLFIADASLFPTASGANPMLSVQGLVWNLGMEM
jgi:choline dehydrogenase-like flavoprotein